MKYMAFILLKRKVLQSPKNYDILCMLHTILTIEYVYIFLFHNGYAIQVKAYTLTIQKTFVG